MHDDLRETLDAMVRPFLWGYYTVLIHLRTWYLQVRWWFSLYFLRVLSYFANRLRAFNLQKIAEGLETCDPVVRPLVERWLQIKNETYNMSERDEACKRLCAECDEVMAKIEAHYDGDWPECFNASRSVDILGRVLDWIDQNVYPAINRGMPWEH